MRKIGPHFLNSGSGHYSHAEGDSNEIYTLFSHAEGRSNVIRASSNWSHVEGRDNLIDSNSSYVHAEGRDNIASSNSLYSHLEGSGNTIISAEASHVEGAGNTIRANLSHAEGYNNTINASAIYAHIEGSGNIVFGLAAHAEGLTTSASGDYSHAEGLQTDASGLAAHAEGRFSEAFGIASHTEGISTRAFGDYSHAEGISTTAYVSASHAEGYQTDASGGQSHAEGYQTKTFGLASHSEGLTTQAQGAWSHAEGESSQSWGKACHVEGFENIITSTGEGSHAEGRQNDISGTFCHAEGFNNNIGENSAYCHIEGITNNIPLGTGSHVEGQGNLIEVTGFPAHAEGAFNKVASLGAYAHAEGFNTIIDTSGGHSTGRFNDMSRNTLFVVGCGTSDATRMDAIYVDTSCITHVNNILEVSGNINVFGDISMNGNQITFIGDATDPSGVPSLAQVQALAGSGGYWTQNGTSIYYNTGNVGIGTTTPDTKLEVIGDISCHDLVLSTPPQDLGSNFLVNLGMYQTSTNSGVLRVYTNAGYINLGPRNSGWCHIETDRDRFYFNKAIVVNGGNVSSYTTSNLSLGTDSTSNVHITCKSGSTTLVGVGNTNPLFTLDVGGDANISENAFVSKSATQSQIAVDKNLYARNTNLLDTLKITYDTFYSSIWRPMIQANTTGTYTNPSTGITYNLTAPNPGKANAVPTFSGAWGPSVIPIAYLDINQNYVPTPFNPGGGQPFQGIAERPYIANTCAYFTIKFAQPHDNNATNPSVDWKTASLYENYGGTLKSGFGAITQQTITFVAGYTDNFKRNPGDDYRKPKPFIKVISTNIPNLKCLNGITTPNGVDAADIDTITQNMKFYGYATTTPKIGGLFRIIIAEGCPGGPADPEIQNKAWLLIEQQWNVEPWQIGLGVDNTNIIQSLVGDHIIDVRMYANNLGDLNLNRNPPFPNQYNTDWQLVTEKSIQEGQQYSWDKFVLPMGNYAIPAVFNTPTIVPPTDVSFTLMVGGTECPNPLTGQIDGVYPQIIPTANLWEVWLNLKDWPYGITSTEEVFESNVDICGNVIIDGTTTAQDIFCQNIDVNNSIDVGPSQELTIVENKITSTNTPTSWAPSFPNNPGPFDPGLWLAAENFYFDCTSSLSTRGFIVSLGDNTSNTIFRIVDNNNNYGTFYPGGTPPLFQVEGSGLTQTQWMMPWQDMTYDLGYKNPSNASQNRRYRKLYVGGIDASGNITATGDITAEGTLIGNDLSCNDISANNIDVANDLNVEGLITGVGDTTFVEYRDYLNDITFNVSGWYCIARTKDTNPTGGADNARGLFIIDDNTSGQRQQIILYAGTSYARGNYINVIANNWYGSTPVITNLKMETNTTYAGANIYIYRQATTVSDRVYVRLYENTRISTTGGEWELTATPHAGLLITPVEIDLTYNPNNNRANSISSLDTFITGEFTAPTIRSSDIEVAATGTLKVKDNNTGASANDVIDVNSTNNQVNFGGYDYTGGVNIIGTPTARDRVVVDLEAGSTQFGLNVADSGSVIRTLGGIKILPLQSNSLGAPPNYAAPGWGSSLFLGEWGWGNQSWNNQLTVRLSQSTNDQNRPGSGNVYCNAVRENIVFSDLNSQGPSWNAGYQGASTNKMYYNQGDIRHIIIDPTNGTNRLATVTLPAIKEPMLGQCITVARTTVPTIFTNYNAALLIKASTGDRINCPHSIFVDDSAFGGIAIDPYGIAGVTLGGYPGLTIPSPYKGDEICSVTLVASQNGYYKTGTSAASGSQVTTQFVWQFISSGGPGL